MLVNFIIPIVMFAVFTVFAVFSFMILGAFGLSNPLDILIEREKIKRLKSFIARQKAMLIKARTNPGIVRDISIGIFVSSIMGLFSATSVYYVIIYTIGIIASLYGIINANDKISK